MPTAQNDERVLILAPTGRDGPLIGGALRGAAVECVVCRDITELCAAIDAGAGAAMVAEEVLNSSTLASLLGRLAKQPAWSDLPLVVLTAAGYTSRGTTRLAEALEPAANVTHLERPVRTLTLVSAVRTALRARRRQYEIRELLAAKEQAIAESQANVRRRDEFLAMLGHELRNPLAAISASLQVLDLLEWQKEACDEQRALLARQSQHLGRLVDDLLDVARVTRGTVVLKKAPVDLCDLARRCAGAMGMQFTTNRLTLSVQTDAKPVVVDGDAVRLEQIVTNLLTNAGKFTPAGGDIRVGVDCEGGYAVLSVRDTGIGIPSTMLVRIFDLFAQAHASIDRTLGGLGLGLTIVHRLVDLHGGSVIARSEGLNRGSEFTVRLPLMVTPTMSAAKDGLRSANSRRVLVVEDNPDTRAVMSKMIRLWGHEVDSAEDGPGGLEKALSMRPDIVLLDIGLPGFDGYEVARQVRSQGLQEICLIAVTGYGQDEDRDQALDAGFNAHLVKPVDFKTLSDIIVKCPAF